LPPIDRFLPAAGAFLGMVLLLTPPTVHAVDLYLELTGSGADLAARHPGLDLHPLLPAATLEKLGLPPWWRGHVEGDEAAWLEVLARDPLVLRVEPVPRFRTCAWQADDPGLPAQWHLGRLGVEEAWVRQRGVPGTVVAIVDTGVDWHHPDLAPNLWVDPGEDLDGDGLWEPEDANGLDDDANGFTDDGAGWDFVDLSESQLWPGEDGFPADNDPDDLNGHGTHCAGNAVAAGFNGLGVASPAPFARLLPVRAGYWASDGQGYVSHGLEGMLYAAAQGARVVSMSFGGPSGGSFWQDAVNALTGQGVVLLAAAGNENSSQRSYPAGFAPVIAVGATDRDDQRASFSNYGSWVDLAAPGVDILSTTRGASWGSMQGTSMATPVAAGVAALLLSTHPSWGADSVLARLQATALPVPGGQLGAGRVDAAAALAGEPWVELSADLERPDTGETVAVPLLVQAGGRALVEPLLEVWSEDEDLSTPPFFQSLDPLAPGAADTVTVGATWLGAGVAEPLLRARLSDQGQVVWDGQLELPCGVTEMLLLDGDSSDNWSVRPWYVEALTGIGRTPDVRRLAAGAVAGLPWERSRELVLFTGSDLDPHLPGGLEDSLRAFRERGGRLLLTGQRLAQGLSPAFLAELGAATTEQAAGSIQVWGVPGTPGVEDLHLLLTGSGGAGNQVSPQVLTAQGAVPTFAWTADGVSRLAGLRTADGSVDLLAFGLEAVNGDPEWSAGLGEVLERLLDGQSALDPGARPADRQLVRCWPNPFNPRLNLRLEGGAPRRVAVFNLAGQRVADLGRLGPGQAVQWSPGPLAAGVYVLRAVDEGPALAERVLWLP